MQPLSLEINDNEALVSIDVIRGYNFGLFAFIVVLFA
jgi:hypothetical protein